MAILVEYRCTKCGETYLPDEPGDGHDVELTGQECGGLGEFVLMSYTPGEPEGDMEATFAAHIEFAPKETQS